MKAIERTSKSCTSCKEVLPSDSFYVMSQTGKKGQVWKYFDAMCKSCRSRYASNRVLRVKMEAVAYKGGKCRDCGLVDHPFLYDFHHEDPSVKEFGIGLEMKKLSRLTDAVKRELDKCVLLCVLCHRRRHLFVP
jgi:hypothetical protein